MVVIKHMESSARTAENIVEMSAYTAIILFKNKGSYFEVIHILIMRNLKKA